MAGLLWGIVMTREQIRYRLTQLAEPEYQAFNGKLLPGVAGLQGVRLPALRQMAKQIAGEDGQGYLRMMCPALEKEDVWYEEKMLFGLVTGYTAMDDIQYREWLDIFVPKIDNWGVCDSCCLTYKWMKRQPAYWWDYLIQWIDTGGEFAIRFGAVCLLDHFVDAAHIRDIFHVCGRIHSDGYYARMAVAWLVSVCFINFTDETYLFLQDNRMDAFTQNKSLQKILESYRVSGAWKEKLRQLREMER